MLPDPENAYYIRVSVDLGKSFWSHTVLVGLVGRCTACEEDLHDGSVSIGSGEVQWSGTLDSRQAGLGREVEQCSPAVPTLGTFAFRPSLYLLGSRGAFTSAPLSINIRTTLTLPPEHAA